MTNDRVAVIVVAAGSGRRLADGGPPKQFRPIAGVPILARALRSFLDHPEIERVVVVLPSDVVASPPEWLASPPIARVAGGKERTDSVRAGLAAVEPGISTVLVHDGARPFVSRRLIDRVLAAARLHPDTAIVPGEPLTDTVKEVGTDGLVVRTVPRDGLWRVQTPQAFPREALRRYHEEAAAVGFNPTDDAMLFERHGASVRIVGGDPTNLKVTTSADLVIAEALASASVRASDRRAADIAPAGDGGGE